MLNKINEKKCFKTLPYLIFQRGIVAKFDPYDQVVSKEIIFVKVIDHDEVRTPSECRVSHLPSWKDQL